MGRFVHLHFSFVHQCSKFCVLQKNIVQLCFQSQFCRYFQKPHYYDLYGVFFPVCPLVILTGSCQRSFLKICDSKNTLVCKTFVNTHFAAWMYKTKYKCANPFYTTREFCHNNHSIKKTCKQCLTMKLVGSSFIAQQQTKIYCAMNAVFWVSCVFIHMCSRFEPLLIGEHDWHVNSTVYVVG